MATAGWILLVTIPLALLMLAALMYNHHLQVKEKNKAQARVVRQKAYSLLEALEYLIQVDNHRDIQKLVLKRVEDLYARANDMAGGETKDTGFDPAPFRARIEEKHPIRTVMHGEQEIRYLRRQFSTVLKMLVPMVRSREISQNALHEYRSYLKTTLLRREVDTYILQGDNAAEKDNIATAANYYKAAKKRLIEFDVQFAEKSEMIKSVTDKAASLFRGEKPSEVSEDDNLSRKLAEEEPTVNEFGIPLSFSEGAKKKY
tara:strand:+ start:53664 stop:54440 length:777 start_codon:yes stop_codon:yes gene_type:complete